MKKKEKESRGRRRRRRRSSTTMFPFSLSAAATCPLFSRSLDAQSADRCLISALREREEHKTNSERVETTAQKSTPP